MLKVHFLELWVVGYKLWVVLGLGGPLTVFFFYAVVFWLKRGRVLKKHGGESMSSYSVLPPSAWGWHGFLVGNVAGCEVETEILLGFGWRYDTAFPWLGTDVFFRRRSRYFLFLFFFLILVFKRTAVDFQRVTRCFRQVSTFYDTFLSHFRFIRDVFSSSKGEWKSIFSTLKSL